MALANQGDMEKVREEVKKDRGKTMWQVYSRFTRHLNAFENKLNERAEKGLPRGYASYRILPDHPVLYGRADADLYDHTYTPR